VSRAKWDRPCQCSGYWYPHRIGSKLCYYTPKGERKLDHPEMNALAYGPAPEVKSA